MKRKKKRTENNVFFSISKITGLRANAARDVVTVERKFNSTVDASAEILISCWNELRVRGPWNSFEIGFCLSVPIRRPYCRIDIEK